MSLFNLLISHKTDQPKHSFASLFVDLHPLFIGHPSHALFINLATSHISFTKFFFRKSR